MPPLRQLSEFMDPKAKAMSGRFERIDNHNCQAYLTKSHFDNMGKLILFTSSIVGYSYGMEYFMAWYSANPFEQMSFWHRGFGYHAISTTIMITCNVIVPLPRLEAHYLPNVATIQEAVQRTVSFA